MLIFMQEIRVHVFRLIHPQKNQMMIKKTMSPF